MDIKNVGDFFCCNGVNMLGDCIVYDFIIYVLYFVEEFLVIEYFEKFFEILFCIDENDVEVVVVFEVDIEVF